MRLNVYFFGIVLLFFSHLSFSQELVSLLDETLIVNSTSAVSGYTRNTANVKLPEKCKSYIYRITIVPKGKTLESEALFTLLKNYGTPELSALSSFTQFAIRNSDNNAVDAFIFNNVYDAENFYKKSDGNWSACKYMMNRANCCFESKECMGGRIFFGFRNNNVMQGLSVRLEVVGIVDSTMEVNYTNSYALLNSTNQELKYYISTDNLNWQEQILRSNYKKDYSFEQREIFIKIFTGTEKFLSYKLMPSERYKFVWNDKIQQWDVIRY